MNKKQEIALLEAIEDFSKAVFNKVGGKKAQDWAVKVANEGYSRDKFSPDEEFYYTSFRLAQIVHKIKYYRMESEDLFHVSES
jgi:hypothetical protein